MTKSNLLKLLGSTELFTGVSADLLEKAAEKYPPKCKEYSKGEIILGIGSSEKQLGLITKGKATVTKGTGSHRVIMGSSQAGSLFGAVTLYNPIDEFVTCITAACITQVYFFTAEFVDFVIDNNSRAAKNYIAYLSKKIYFLNSKIDSFTGDTATSRLAFWLNEHQNGNGIAVLPCSAASFSQRLDVGRASLYRSFNELESENIIERNGKSIVIKDGKRLSEKI